MSDFQQPEYTPKKLTKKQLAWRPGQTKVRRSSRVMFASVILVLEALVVFFAGLTVFGLRGRAGGGAVPLLISFCVLAVIFVLACAVVNKSWGLSLGWGLQVLLVLMGILEPTMFIVGIAFLLTWGYAMVKGAQMDRDNAERAQEQARWEAEHPEG